MYKRVQRSGRSVPGEGTLVPFESEADRKLTKYEAYSVEHEETCFTL